MQIGSASITLLVLAGCAAAPAPRGAPAARLRLRERPEVGARYVSSFELRFTLYDRELLARRRMTSTVVAADGEGAVFDHHVDAGSFELLHPRLVLPPSPDELLGATIRERRDPRGNRAGALDLRDGTEAQRASLRRSEVEQTVGAPRLPDGPVEEGTEWRTNGRWAFRLRDADPEARRELVYRVTALRGNWVEIAIRGEANTGGARIVVEGELSVDRRDATVSFGRLTGSVGGEASGLSGYEISFHTAREGSDAPPAWAPRDPALPRSRVFEGDACDARVDELASRFDRTPAGRPLSTDVEVPTVERGVEAPWSGTLTVAADGYRVDQGPIDLAGAVEHVGILARNASLLRLTVGEEGVPIVLFAASDAPASRVLELVAGPPPRTAAFHLAVRLADPPALPAVYAEGTPEAVEALARGLTTPELASLAVGTCTPLVTAFGQSADLAPAALWTHHRVAIPAALRECGCAGVDVDLLDATLQRIVQGDRDPALRVLPIPADPRALRLRRRATVADLAAAMAGAPAAR